MGLTYIFVGKNERNQFGIPVEVFVSDTTMENNECSHEGYYNGSTRVRFL